MGHNALVARSEIESMLLVEQDICTAVCPRRPFSNLFVFTWKNYEVDNNEHQNVWVVEVIDFLGYCAGVLRSFFARASTRPSRRENLFSSG